MNIIPVSSGLRSSGWHATGRRTARVSARSAWWGTIPNDAGSDLYKITTAAVPMITCHIRFPYELFHQFIYFFLLSDAKCFTSSFRSSSSKCNHQLAPGGRGVIPGLATAPASCCHHQMEFAGNCTFIRSPLGGNPTCSEAARVEWVRNRRMA